MRKLFAILVVALVSCGSLALADRMEFGGLGDGTELQSHTENGLFMQAVDCGYGPKVNGTGGDDNIIHFDGGHLDFDYGGTPFNLIAIDFETIDAPPSEIEITNNLGYMLTLPATVANSTYFFDVHPEFQSILSFTLDPVEDIPCVEIDYVEFTPEPATLSLLLLGGLAVLKQRR